MRMAQKILRQYSFGGLRPGEFIVGSSSAH
jgi:hypothetical protein